ncbi:retrotransposon protein, putative, ty1-copia subclass [Tanacetum coccineum]
MFIIEQPLPVALAADYAANVLLEWNAVYDAYIEVACLILGSMTLELHREFKNSSPYDMITELKAMFEKQAEVERNYNMHNMGKTVGELHAMLIEYEKGLPKKAKIPQVMMIKSGKIQKANKKSLKVKGKGKANSKRKDKQVYIPKPKNPKPSAKEHPAKDDACHHCKEVGHWKRNFPVYLAELLKKKKQVGSTSSSAYGIFQQLTPPYTPQHNGVSERRNCTLLDMVRSMINLTTLPLSFWDYALESETHILNMVPTKKVDKTPYEYGWGKFQIYEDTIYFENTSEIPMEVEGFEPPQEEEIPIRRNILTGRCTLELSRILISIAAYYDYEIWQMDIKTAFLNGYLDEDIYMVQPEGFVDPNHSRKVCSFKDSFMVLSEHQEVGIKDLMEESKSLQSVNDYLGKCFAMKDLEEAAFILGIKIYRDRSKRLIGLGQNAYMDKILKRYKMDNSKRGHIPLQERLDLNKTQGASTPEEVNHMQNVPYASAVEYKDMFLVYGGNPKAELRVDCYCDAGFETEEIRFQISDRIMSSFWNGGVESGVGLEELQTKISSISIGSSNVQPSESPYLPVLFIGTSQSRQHDKSESNPLRDLEWLGRVVQRITGSMILVFNVSNQPCDSDSICSDPVSA